METKRISSEEVRNIMLENRRKGDRAMIEAAMVGLREGPMPVQIDPQRPFALQMRHTKEDQGPEQDWCVHPWRFPDIYSAGRAAKDLQRLDKRLEVRVTKT